MAYIVILPLGLEEGNQSQMSFLVEVVGLAKTELTDVTSVCTDGDCSNIVDQMPAVYFILL